MHKKCQHFLGEHAPFQEILHPPLCAIWDRKNLAPHDLNNYYNVDATCFLDRDLTAIVFQQLYSETKTFLFVALSQSRPEEKLDYLRRVVYVWWRPDDW